MKIVTDKSHVKATLKEQMFSKKVNKIVKNVLILGLITGTVMTFSGCTRGPTPEQIQTRQFIEAQAIQFEKGLNLNSSNISLQGVPLTNDFVQDLTPNVKRLNLRNSLYLSDLALLPNYAPNLEFLDISRVAGITDYSFLTELPNLKEFRASNNPGITQELLDYLYNRGISTDLTQRDVQNNDRLNEIANQIINPDMDEREKIQAISLFVIDNVEYDLDTKVESNERPLDLALDGIGVCAGISHLTTALGRMADLDIGGVANYNHRWNIIQIDGNFYYLDPTNMGSLPFANRLLSDFNISDDYMQNPFDTSFSAMSPADEALLPSQVVQLIEEMQDEQSFIERYGTNSYRNALALLAVIVAVAPLVAVAKRRR